MAINEKVFAHYFGRFHADPQMPPGTPTRIYEEWVRSAFAGWADWILVAELDAQIAGYGFGERLWKLKRDIHSALRIMTWRRLILNFSAVVCGLL
jgi:hypothetical protein